jgi:hypothetical protein
MNLSLHRHWKLIAAAAAILLLGWAFLHPPLRPAVDEVSPAIRAELEKTGFASTKRITSAQFENVETIEGLAETWKARQSITPIDKLITEKRTYRHAKGISEETVGLFVGPLTVVRHHRNRPPFVADLLPYQFWTAMRLTDIAVEEVTNFPSRPGGRLQARVTYEERYAGGDLALTERRHLSCQVASVVAANSLHPTLTGEAARVDCHEELIPDGRQWGTSNPKTYSVGKHSFSHWFAFDTGWSIPIETESAVRVGDMDGSRKWTTKLISFETDGS